ncbi:MAG: MATE family efflux transporter [Paracoccaceae bacterium]
MKLSNPIIHKLFLLALPLIGSNVAQFSLNIVDTAMLGHYSSEALASAVIGGSFFFSIFIIGSGFSFAIVPLVAAYDAKGDHIKVRRVARMGLWISFIYSLLALNLFLFSETILLAIGQNSEISKIAEEYLILMGFSMFPALAVVTLRSFLTGLKFTHVIFWITFAAFPIKIILNWILIFGNLGIPELGIKGASLSTLLVQFFMLICFIFFLYYKLYSYKIFNSFWRLDFDFLKKVFLLGYPIGFTYFAETSLFTSSAIMMGWLGKIELAAHGITMQLAGLTFMFHVGLSQASTTLVGNSYGKKEDKIKLFDIAKATLLLTTFYAFIVICLFVTFPEFLLSLFLDKKIDSSNEIINLAVLLLMFAAIFHLVDGLQASGLGLLRGIQDVQIPFMLALISYWIFGIGSGYILGFIFNIGSIGIWLGMVIGLTLASISLILRFYLKINSINFTDKF